MDFAKFAAKGNEIINKISVKAEIPEDKASRILRATLHTLRNRIGVDESFHFLAQLPIVLKGIYVDGWKPNTAFVRIKHLHDFFDEVRSQDTGTAAYDLGNDKQAKQLMGVVFQVLREYISEGAFEHLTGQFSEEIQDFLRSTKKEEPTVW